MAELYISGWRAWAPGVETSEDWMKWAESGSPSIMESGTPALSHLPPVSKRRLSQLSKMVLEAGHQMLQESGPLPIIFCSRFGEINQQQKITKKMIENGEVLPASFSLSVFNTPVSLLSIHENVHHSIAVNLSSEHCLFNGLVSLISQLNTLKEESCMMIFADESLPDEYAGLTHLDSKPYAYAFVAGRSGNSENRKIEYSITSSDSVENISDHPLDFLRWYLQEDSKHIVFRQGGLILKMKKI